MKEQTDREFARLMAGVEIAEMRVAIDALAEAVVNLPDDLAATFVEDDHQMIAGLAAAINQMVAVGAIPVFAALAIIKFAEERHAKRT